jgi:YVTN family beta-propeller protein
LAVAAGLVVAVAPVATAADSTTYLNGVTGGGDVAAGGGKVFVAGNDRIVVADTRGALTGAITGLSGAVGLAVTPDGTRLYAALSGSNEVAEIDTAALTIARRIALAAYPCPSHLSLSGSRLWVGYGCAPTWDGGILSLDLSATAPQPVRIATGLSGPPMVAAAGSTLVAGETGISPGDLRVYDVSADPATLRGVIDGHTHFKRALARTAPTTAAQQRYQPPTRSSPSSKACDYADDPSPNVRSGDRSLPHPDSPNLPPRRASHPHI